MAGLLAVFAEFERGLFVTASSKQADDWLTLAAGPDRLSRAFRMDNWYPAKHPFCIRSGDFVQLQSQLHPGYYWNWYLGFSGNYGYYLKENDSSNQLRLQILDDHGGCLRDGDRIAFLDKDAIRNRDAYLGVSGSGSWQNHMFLGSNSLGSTEVFQIEIPEEPVYTDWSSRLRYQD